MTQASRADRYQKHLNGVSRSFSFAIEQLEMPLRVPVGLSYLICRILDTIEDAPWASFAKQTESFKKFAEFIESPHPKNEIMEWAAKIPSEISLAERALLDECWQIFQDFHEGPVSDRVVIRPAVLSMSAGMQHFMNRKQREGNLRLTSLPDVDRYCFFVAGLVGDILTGLVVAHQKELGLDAKDLSRISLVAGLHFGLFLQKINLLKDQRGDELEGRFLVPSRVAVWASLRQESEIAFQYISQIPHQLKGYRLFCAGSLFLGLASLPWIETSYSEKSNTKIPRLKTLALMAEIALIIGNDDKLKNLFAKLSAEALSSGPQKNEDQPSITPEDVDTLLKLYKGPIEKSDIRRILTSP